MDKQAAEQLRDKLTSMILSPDGELPTFTNEDLTALVMVSVSGLMSEIDNLRTICQMLEAVCRINTEKVSSLSTQVKNLTKSFDEFVLGPTGND